jgi:COP9 signalosome complex subunit 2
LARELLESRSDTSDLELSQLLHDMRASCLNAEGNEDVVNKGAQLLDVYSIEIQRLNSFRTRDGVKRMKQIMTKCALASSAVSNPRSMGIIRENAGKILMDDGWYDDAYNEFFESFKAYADTGNARARSVLKYAVVANILSLSTINPFDSREAKAFLNDPEIMMILKLRQAFDQRDLGALDTILKGSSFSMKNDSWLEPHLGELIYRIKLKFLGLLVGVHRRVRLVKLAGRLGVDTKTISRMLMRLFLDQKVPNLSLDDEYCHLHFNESGGIEAIVRSSCQLMVATQGLNEKLDTVRNKH